MVMLPALPAANVPSERRAVVVTIDVVGPFVDATAVDGTTAVLPVTTVLPVTSTALVGTTDVADAATEGDVTGGAAEVGAGAAARRTTAFTMAAALPTTSNEHTDAIVATRTFICPQG
jgi:hypothetical protein